MPGFTGLLLASTLPGGNRTKGDSQEYELENCDNSFGGIGDGDGLHRQRQRRVRI